MAWVAVWTHAAVRDLHAAHEHVGKRGRAQGRGFARAIRRSVEHLESHPMIGMVAPDLEPEGRYRHLIEPPYRIIYRLDEDEERIIILRVWHGRRDPASLQLNDPV